MLQTSSKPTLLFTNKHTSSKSIAKPSPLNLQARTRKAYQVYCQASSSKQQTKSLWNLMKLCYNNQRGQAQLLKLLNLPETAGPISLNPLPISLCDHDQKIGEDGDERSTQLQFLFEFLKNVQESYFCWVIYFSEELKVLNLKLLRQDQLSQFQQLFNPNLNLIGIFATKQKPTKTPQNQHLAKHFYEEQTDVSKKHVKSTPNNSTGSSWQQQELTQFNAKFNKFKFRSISPKVRIQSKGIVQHKEQQNNRTKITKSLSVIARISKSKSSFLKGGMLNEKPKLSSTFCALKMDKNLKTKGKLKKQSKVHRFERLYNQKV